MGGVTKDIIIKTAEITLLKLAQERDELQAKVEGFEKIEKARELARVAREQGAFNNLTDDELIDRMYQSIEEDGGAVVKEALAAGAFSPIQLSEDNTSRGGTSLEDTLMDM